MKRKLIAFDIDGTLLGTDKKALDSTREALVQLKEAGHLVTVATGRSRYLARDVIRDLDFENYIVCNGSAAFLSHNQVFKHLLDANELDRLVATANQQGIDTAFIEMDRARRLTSNNVGAMAQAMMSFGAGVPEFDDQFPEEQEVYQALAFFGAEYQGQFEAAFPLFRFVRWHENCVDVVPQNGSKAATIQFLAERVGIAPQDIIAFGDGNNDKEMLSQAGVGVAMGNAASDVQSQADMVTADCDHDGIWKALKTLELI